MQGEDLWGTNLPYHPYHPYYYAKALSSYSSATAPSGGRTRVAQRVMAGAQLVAPGDACRLLNPINWPPCLRVLLACAPGPSGGFI